MRFSQREREPHEGKRKLKWAKRLVGEGLWRRAVEKLERSREKTLGLVSKVGVLVVMGC